MDIIPRDGAREANRAVREAGRRYQNELGWAVFLQRVGADGVRRSLPMCDPCRTRAHDRTTCPHRTCHGFYAATRDPGEWDRMCDAFPDTDALCVRTGRASGIFVVDFDEKHGGPEAHDRWGEATGLGWSFGETLRQRTRSGGFHLVYRLPGGHDSEVSIRSRSGVTVRGVDTRGEGGLVCVAPSGGYDWQLASWPEPGALAEALREPSAEVLDWALTAPLRRDRRTRAGDTRLTRRLGDRLNAGLTTAPGTLADASRAGCKAGGRDEYVNSLVFLLRKTGVGYDEAAGILRDEWNRMEHPEGDEFRWEWCVYKLDRVWRDVAPDLTTSAGRSWLEQARDRARGEPPGGDAGGAEGTAADVVTVGRVTTTRRSAR